MKLIIKYNWNIILATALCLSLVSCQIRSTLAQSSNASIDDNYVIKGDFTNMKVDKLGDIYLINKKSEILKYDENYNLLFRNSYNTQGRISHIDVSNPQKILVYFSDFQKILFLDNTLSEIKFLNLESLGYWNIQAVAPSVDNLIWIYDPVDYKLIKINDNGNVLLNSNELYSEGIGGNVQPGIIARDDRVYLYTESEILVFNIFGELLKRLSINSSSLQYLNSNIIYLQNKNLMVRNTKTEFITDADRKLFQYEGEVSDFYLDKKNQLFSLDRTGLFVTSLDQ